MEIEKDINQLLMATLRACLAGDIEITSVVELPLSGAGYSGARMRRFYVRFHSRNGGEESIELLVKDASLVERRTQLHLYRQGQRCIPFCYTENLLEARRAPLCMEYVASTRGKPSLEERQFAAAAVAAIHTRNLHDLALLEWLPPADAAFIESGFVMGTFRTAWECTLEEADFRREFGHVTTALAAAAQRFTRDVAALWIEGDTLTLIHGDLHDGNVLVRKGQPLIVDWEQARCGSFYLDLPNLFPGEAARSYYQALMKYGFEVDENQFFERYRAMGRYVGFKYMGFVLAHWSQRLTTAGSWVRGSLENLVDLALNGANPHLDHHKG